MSGPVIWDELGKALLSARLRDSAAVVGGYALPGGAAPRGVIYINDVETLQSTVRWARAQRQPLVAVSSAGPHFHSALGMPEGAVVADFSRMKRVIVVNRRNRVALFEAGVTFEDLCPLLTNAGSGDGEEDGGVAAVGRTGGTGDIETGILPAIKGMVFQIFILSLQ